jgi:hypothetical protein
VKGLVATLGLLPFAVLQSAACGNDDPNDLGVDGAPDADASRRDVIARDGPVEARSDASRDARLAACPSGSQSNPTGIFDERLCSCEGQICEPGHTCRFDFHAGGPASWVCACSDGLMRCCMLHHFVTSTSRCSGVPPVCPAAQPADGAACGPSVSVCPYTCESTGRPSLRFCNGQHWEAGDFDPGPCESADGGTDAALDAPAE